MSADRDTPRWLVFYCGCLMTISAFSTDAMLPAVHAMALDLDVPITWSQATIPAFIAPFAFGQLFFGPASDQFGRRPLIALGMTVFLAGSLLATLGSSIEFVLAGRGLQGFGAAAGPVLARAILRDCYSGTALARSMSTAMAIFSIGPILAPFIGYGIQSMGHWRLIFAALAAFAAGLLPVNIFVFRESLRKRREGALRHRIVDQGQKVCGICRAFRMREIHAFADHRGP